MYVSGFEQSFDPFQGMMAPATVSKTITVVRKHNVEDRFQYVQKGGLHHSITYCRNPKWALLLASRFWNPDPLYGLRNVGVVS